MIASINKGEIINQYRSIYAKGINLSYVLVFAFFIAFITGCENTKSKETQENKLDWFYGKWQPTSDQEKNFTAMIFPLVRVGYEIKKDTIIGYVSQDFVSDPAVLMRRVLMEDDATKERLSRSFYKVSEATYRIKSIDDTVCEIEFLSGKELKFGYDGWVFPAKVVQGTILKFKKSGENIIFERKLNSLNSYTNLTNDEIIQKQAELMFLLGNSELGGIYKLHLHHMNFSIDNNYKFTEEDKKGLHVN